MAQVGHRRAAVAGGGEAAEAPAAQQQSTGQRILAAGKALFLTAGYDGVNLDQVAQRAGVARQTVYNRFGSKEAVFRAVVQQHWTFFQFEDVSQPAVASLDDPEPALRRFAEAVVAFVSGTEQIAFARLVVAESRRSPWIAEEFYQLGKQPLLAALTGLLAQLTEADLLACAEPELAAHQFLGLVQEFVVWPKVMAIGAPAQALPAAEVVIDEALLTFLSRYRGRGAR